MHSPIITTQEGWVTYTTTTLERLAPILSEHEIVLDTAQPHIGGERFLMQAVTTAHGKKLILVGSYKGVRAIIKIADDTHGIAEIEHERLCRTMINKIDFAGSHFSTPLELAHFTISGFLISIQQFIEQESTFLERPLIEQFNYALAAFKAQESAHVATYRHARSIKHVFQVRNAQDYLQSFAEFKRNIASHSILTQELSMQLEAAERFLQKEEKTIEQYCGFLTHTDFVPHNLRIQKDNLFLLDYSALIFGNKYEGWARFLNFMVLYNRPLEAALMAYVQDNRTPEETLSLQLMRVYRLGEILWYYVRTLEKSTDDLLTLNTARVHFWGQVLTHLLKKESIPDSLITQYQTTRDSLRSEDEKKRQKGLH